MAALLEAQHLYRYYGRYCAVEDLSLELHAGEVLGLLGVNGAGKSTTLQMFSGTLAPNKGKVILNNKDLFYQPLLAKQFLGYLPQQPPLYYDLTVIEFLSYCAQLHQIHSSKLNEYVDIALQRCGLTEVRKRLIKELSKGYQQRLGIAQAIVHQPPVIIFDEPTVGLDPIQVSDIRQLIQSLSADHGIILSSHILSEIQACCTRVLIIDQGKLIFNESIANLNPQQYLPSLQLTTKTVVDIQQIMNISGITQVEIVNDYQYIIQYSPKIDPTEALIELIISKQWGLVELKRLASSLEAIFIQLAQSSKKFTS
ncbi:MAG: hypothetical protein RL637_523 [Pseudomonadota bacterium]|jgi:ABC-2 type transport system ATP-binding protein